MTMREAVRSAFAGWCTFNGRAGGTEYWLFVLFGTIVFGLAILLDHAVFGRDVLFGICTLVFLMPYLAVAVRRLHDTNHSGWWLLLKFVPLAGDVVLLIWFCTPSTSGANRFQGGTPVDWCPERDSNPHNLAVTGT